MLSYLYFTNLGAAAFKPSLKYKLAATFTAFYVAKLFCRFKSSADPDSKWRPYRKRESLLYKTLDVKY